MGLPLHTFGQVDMVCHLELPSLELTVVIATTSKGAFFQPYLPLQEIDMLRSDSWLVGTTNSIVTQQKDCQWDLLISVSPGLGIRCIRFQKS
jgi:hypothetical protein